MNTVVDEVLNTSATGNKIKFTITPDGGTPYTATIELATPVSTTGTPINKQLFDSIQADITSLNNNKLNVSAKASQGEAEAGTNDTKYMTPLKVKQENATQKITYVQIPKWTTTTQVLTFSNYIASNTVKLELIIDNVYEATYRKMQFAGTKIRTVSGINGGTTTYDVGSSYNYVQKATLKIEIYPLIKRVFINGIATKITGASSGTATTETISEQFGYDTLTSLTVGKLNDSVNPVYNADYPIIITQYTK